MDLKWPIFDGFFGIIFPIFSYILVVVVVVYHAQNPLFFIGFSAWWCQKCYFSYGFGADGASGVGIGLHAAAPSTKKRNQPINVKNGIFYMFFSVFCSFLTIAKVPRALSKCSSNISNLSTGKFEGTNFWKLFIAFLISFSLLL